MNELNFKSAKYNDKSNIWRVSLIVLVLFMTAFQLFISFRGLEHSAAMDQAQIARNIAQGNGFSTGFIRPKQLLDASAHHDVDVSHFRDTNYAPLHVYALAGALSITGMDDFEDCRMSDDGIMIYAPDRVIAATSAIFFLIALFLSYLLIRKLFDEVVAMTVVLMMSLSDVLLQFSTSGLAQPMMMCFLMGAILCLRAAAQAYSAGLMKRHMYCFCACFALVSLLCLSSWMAIWLALALIVYVGFAYKPYGFYALSATAIIIMFLLLPLASNFSATGLRFGNLYYSLYNCFGANEDVVMRSVSMLNIPFDNSGFLLRLLGNSFAQLESFYMKMGTIIVVPFFFLALFNKYKSDSTESIKWAVFAMWLFACLGMSLFAPKSTINASQIYILLTPLFAAYGVSLVFILIAKNHSGSTYIFLRSSAIFALVLVSAGPFLASLPMNLYRGIWLSTRNQPHFPPYYPLALNTSLVEKTNEEDVIVSDQPWAIAWYANRLSMWTPLRVRDFTDDLLPLIKISADVQAFLVTPSSYTIDRQAENTTGGLSGVLSKNGEFAPLAIEGALLLLSPTKNFLFGDLFANTTASGGIGHLISSRGTYRYRQPVLGAHILLYTKAIPKSNQ